MGMEDRGLAYKPRILSIDANKFSTMLLVAETDASLQTANEPLGALTKLGTVGLTGILIVDDDIARHVLQAPSDMDWEREMKFRVRFATDSTDSGTEEDALLFTVALKIVGYGVVTAAADELLDTPIPEFTILSDTANIEYATAWGTLNENSLFEQEGGDFDQKEMENSRVILDVVSTSRDAGLTDSVYVTGVDIAYYPRLTVSAGNSLDLVDSDNGAA